MDTYLGPSCRSFRLPNVYIKYRLTLDVNTTCRREAVCQQKLAANADQGNYTMRRLLPSAIVVSTSFTKSCAKAVYQPNMYRHFPQPSPTCDGYKYFVSASLQLPSPLQPPTTKPTTPRSFAAILVHWTVSTSVS
jgi:hypothetical protein